MVLLPNVCNGIQDHPAFCSQYWDLACDPARVAFFAMRRLLPRVSQNFLTKLFCTKLSIGISPVADRNYHLRMS
jgi:hypothetical protein